MTRDVTAPMFGVRTVWIRRLLQSWRETGSISAQPRRGGYAPSLHRREETSSGRGDEKESGRNFEGDQEENTIPLQPPYIPW